MRMRRGRVRVGQEEAEGIYHCCSRVVDRRFIFHEAEKEHFVALLRECAAFCEVRVLTYCVMSNHFHLLLQVPRAPDELPPAEVIVDKLRRLSGHQSVGAVVQQLEGYQRAGDEVGYREYLAKFHARMWDLSMFMKLLKQRFSQWYNRRTKRKGTLWEDRFKSVVVEGSGTALLAVASYVDLNPGRAGMVTDPKDYRWSGYGEAVAGRSHAVKGLGRVVGFGGRPQEVLAAYRLALFHTGGADVETVGEDGRLLQGKLRRQAVLRVLARKGRLPLGEYVRCRVRYFCDGVVLGQREFVERLFERYRGWFGPKRRSGARPMRGLAGPELCTWRDLRADVFG